MHTKIYNIGRIKIKTFSDFRLYDNEGKFLPVEETITEENNVFYDGGLSSSFTDGQRVILRSALKTMTERQRQVILCLEYHGMTQEEAATLLDIERSVISKHYKAAMKKLKKFCLDK